MASERKFGSFVVYFGARNRFYFIRKHPEYVIPLSIKIMLETVISAIKTILNRDMRVFASIFRGIYDGLLGRFSEVERGKVIAVIFNANNENTHNSNITTTGPKNYSSDPGEIFIPIIGTEIFVTPSGTRTGL